MICPACEGTLTPIRTGSVTIDACSGGCGGLWFDQLELKRIDETEEQDGASLLDIPVNPAVSVDPEKRRHCPKCPDIVMMRFSYSPGSQVQVDHCGECGGHWLDAGELRQIRAGHMPEADRRARLDALLQARLGDELAVAKVRREAETHRHHPLFSIVRYLFPQYV